MFFLQNLFFVDSFNSISDYGESFFRKKKESYSCDIIVKKKSIEGF